MTDTGEGIAPEVLPRLFEAFAQADASTTRRHGGTGLGLALTRHTARLMGGDAGAESVPGQGSRFWFTARLRLAGASAPRPAAPPAATGPALPARALGPAEQRLRARVAGHRVLLAEDNPVNREVAVELLQAVGLQVLTAGDGADALRQALAQPVDLVLMDVQMPGMDGLEATRRIRAAGLRLLPIIAMTANAFGEDRAACLAAGMHAHVSKPVDPERLYESLLLWLPLAAGRPPVPAAGPDGGAARQPGLLVRLAAVGGLDLAQALRHLGGDEGRLRRVLGHFAQACRGGVGGVLDRRALHALRGACAQVGAVPLQHTLERLERACASPTDQPPAPEAQAVAQALARLVQQLALALAQ